MRKTKLRGLPRVAWRFLMRPHHLARECTHRPSSVEAQPRFSGDGATARRAFRGRLGHFSALERAPDQSIQGRRRSIWPRPWSATSGGDSSASSANGIRRAVPRCGASTSTSSPAVKAMHFVRSPQSQDLDVALGRSEAALEAYRARLEGKAQMRVVPMGPAQGLSLHRPQAFPQCPQRGRPLPGHPHPQSSLPGLLEGTRPGRQQEPRLALVDAPAPPQPQARVVGVEPSLTHRKGCWGG